MTQTFLCPRCGGGMWMNFAGRGLEYGRDVRIVLACKGCGGAVVLHGDWFDTSEAALVDCVKVANDG